MLDSLWKVINLCLFRVKPQDLPVSRNLTWATVGIAFAVYMIGNTYLSGNQNTFLLTTTQLAMLGGSLWLLLAMFRKPERWTQSASALYGASAITHLAALPLLASVSASDGPVEKMSGSMVGIAAFQIWFFAVVVFILKETLEITLGLAIVISFVLQLVFGIVLVSLFGNALA